jgi:DNA repair protein RadA/Sms
VLEKRGGFKFGTQDVFLNIAGGIYVDDPAIDLAIVSALLSSYEDKPITPGLCFAGEVGLSGEVRGVNRIEQRVAEAERLGFERIVISSHNRKGLKKLSIDIQAVSKVEELYRLLF